MSGAALLEAWIDAGTNVDSLWSMYIVVHLGLFWFFFLVHRPLLIVERVIAFFAYTCFAYINGKALINAYHFVEAIRRDLVLRFGSELANAPDTLAHLTRMNYAAREEIILVTHLGGLAVVFLLFLMRNVMIRRYFRDFPEQAKRQSSVID